PLQLPSIERTPSLRSLSVGSGLRQTFTPATIAESHLPSRIAETAKSKQSREDAQVESIGKLGPFKSKLYEILFANIARQQPSPLNPLISSTFLSQNSSDSEAVVVVPI